MGWDEVSTRVHTRGGQFLCHIRNVSAVLRLPPYTGRVDTKAADYWPGKRFGLPQNGPRSTPTYLRRVLALGVDWAIAVGISFVFFDYHRLAIVGVFVVLSMVSGLFTAGTPGHLVCGIRIAPIKGGALGVVAPLVRPLLVATVIPALIADDDMRGGHDRLVGTILVRR
jgi:uncharacterized RDD family membrane protein YckC